MASLKDAVRGKTWHGVGNWPSLKQTPLEDFIGVPAIDMNKIDLIYKRSKWRTSLVMCVNNIVIKQKIAACRANPIPTYLAWKARWFVRRKPDHIHYFDLRESEAFQSDAAKGFGSGVTVTYAALQKIGRAHV